MRVRINVRGVDAEVWESFRLIRDEEQTCLGRLVTEALQSFTESYMAGEDDLHAAVSMD